LSSLAVVGFGISSVETSRWETNIIYLGSVVTC
jgi:hypothetical protein